MRIPFPTSRIKSAAKPIFRSVFVAVAAFCLCQFGFGEEWSEGTLVSAEIRSTRGGPIDVRLGQEQQTFATKKGDLIELRSDLASAKINPSSSGR